jgi:hypothetical protein
MSTALAIPIALGLLPVAYAQDNATDINPDNDYIPKTSNDPKVLADIETIETALDFKRWKKRADNIRSGTSVSQCYGNLSIALSQIGNLYQADASGASGALTLLPTAGALIGAPAKELWVLYKLVPIAGILSMLLSLGGNIVPQNLTEYGENSFTYEGMIATEEMMEKNYMSMPNVENMNANEFSELVARRARSNRGSSKRGVAIVGITAQLCWIATILVACYITQSGGVVVWWCKVCGLSVHHRVK